MLKTNLTKLLVFLARIAILAEINCRVLDLANYRLNFINL